MLDVTSLPREAVLAGLLVLGLLALTWRGNAVGTSARPDLPTPKGGSIQRMGWLGLFTRLPLIGDTLAVLFELSRIYEWMLLFAEEEGDVATLTLPGKRFILIYRPEWIEWISSQKGNFVNYEKGWLQTSPMRDVLGKGIFAADGPTWLKQRKATSRIFSAQSFRGIIGSSIESHLDILTSVIEKRADTGATFPLSQLFFDFTLDSFTNMAFGCELSSMTSETPIPFASAFDYAQKRVEHRIFMPGWQLWEPFTPIGWRMRKAVATLDEFCYGVIDERDRLEAAGKLSNEKGQVDMLSIFRSIRHDDGQPLTRKELRDAVLNLIIAGRDTTAQALSWLFYYVIAQPELLDPIREEAGRLLPDGGAVTYDNFRSLVQTNALFHEVLRLSPSVPKNAKVALRDDVMPQGGPVVRAGDLIAYSGWAMARLKSVWGEDAKDLRPSRWIDENGHFQAHSAWKFNTFNGSGPRHCLGQTLATYEAVAVIVRLARTFNFEFAPGWRETTPMTGDIVDCGMPTPLYGSSLTLPMRVPMMVRARRRDLAT